MKEETVVAVHVEDQNHNNLNCGFDIGDGVVDEMMGTFGETEIWLGSTDDHHNNINLLNDFPPLPQFPCISSTSSSSSTPALTNNFLASSSASSAVFKSDAQDRTQDSMVILKCDAATPAPALSSTEGFQPSHCGGVQDVNCMDVVENFGYMDLIEDGDHDDVWDPSTIFENHHDDQQNPDQELHHHQIQENGKNEVVEERMMLKAIFFEWLKTNKENISVQEMRNIKLKKATVECASRRLGNTKEGKKRLVKLILQWVEQYLHHKKQIRKEPAGSSAVVSAAPGVGKEPEGTSVVVAAPAAVVASSATSLVHCQHQYPFPNPNPNPNSNSNLMDYIDPNTCMMWIRTPHESYVHQVAVTSTASASHPPGTFRPFEVSAAPNPSMFLPPMGAYNYMSGEHPNYISGDNVAPLNCQPYTDQVQREYQMLDSVRFVLAPQYNSFTENSNSAPIEPKPIAAPVYSGDGERGRLGASATKEARKNRMARKKRSPWFSYRHQLHQKQHHKNELQEQLDFENWTNDDGQTNCSNWIYEGAENFSNNNIGPDGVNWVYWPAAVGVPMLVQPPMEAQPLQLEWRPDDRTSTQPAQSNQLQVESEREEPKQKLRFERNLKFLLQKVLKQSDVGSLGRIVLPKKEAETQLPQLETRDGIIISMEDIGTSNVWNLRYRYWPNNKSKMYVLENTGEFVKANGLQEGDFIVIYSDIKCGKYLIRGVKVRQSARTKPEAKTKAARQNKNCNSAGHSSIYPI